MELCLNHILLRSIRTRPRKNVWQEQAGLSGSHIQSLFPVPDDLPLPTGDLPAFTTWTAVAKALNVSRSSADLPAMCVEECTRDCNPDGSRTYKCFGKVGLGD